MKKVNIAVNVLSISISIFSLISCILSAIYCNNQWNNYYLALNWEGEVDLIDNAVLEQFSDAINSTIFCIASALCTISALIILILTNPKLFRKTTYTDLSAEWAKNKAERAAARSAKAEAEKQKQIAELEQKLNELKKDE